MKYYLHRHVFFGLQKESDVHSGTAVQLLPEIRPKGMDTVESSLCCLQMCQLQRIQELLAQILEPQQTLLHSSSPWLFLH